MHQMIKLLSITLSLSYAFCLQDEISITGDMIKAVEELETQATHKITGSQCTFFAGARYSVAESSLVNCSWYRNNACCKRIEVTSVFGGMPQLAGASQRCRNMMNYLMCYFCSPEQHSWFRNNKVIVCKSFCESLYQNCKTASAGGKYIESEFSSGVEFCESNNFGVELENVNCFKFNPKVFGAADTAAAASALLAAAVAAVAVVVIAPV